MSNIQSTTKLKKFQVNRSIVFSNGASKSERTGLLSRYNKPQYWETLEGDLEALIEALNAGYTVRPGVKEGGNNKQSVTGVDFLFFDFDTDSQLSDVLDQTFYRGFWYYTLSHDFNKKPEESDRFRIVLELERTATVAEAEQIYKYFLANVYPTADKACKDAGRLYFAGSPQHPVERFGEEEDPLSVESLLMIAKMAETAGELDFDNSSEGEVSKEPSKVSRVALQKTTKKRTRKTNERIPRREKVASPEVDSYESITDKALAYFYQAIFLEKLNGKCPDLYSVGFNHNFKERQPDAEGIVAKYEGNNPFSPTDSSGTSFVISYKEGQLPVFYDRSNNYTELVGVANENRHGSSFLGYWHALKHPGEEFVFCKFVREICEHFEVEDFYKVADIKPSAEVIYQELKEVLNGRLYCDRYSTGWNGFIVEEGKWSRFPNLKNMFKKIILPEIRNIYGESPSLYNLKLANKLASMFEMFWESDQEKPPVENLRYFPVQNGLYDVVEKKLIPNEGQAQNSHVYPHDYEPVPDDNPVIQKFTSYWSDWTNDESKGTALLDWAVLAVQRQAYQTEKIFGLVGTSGKGKTTYCSLLHTLVGAGSVKPDSELFMSGYNHATEVIEGKTLIFLEELGSNQSRSGSILKTLAGNVRNRTISINPKGLKQYNTDFYGSVMFDCEAVPYMGSDAGSMRRLALVQVDETFKDTDGEAIEYFYQNQETIINWCLQQDTNKHLESFRAFTQLETHKEAIHSVRVENDSLALFIQDSLEVSSKASDVVLTDQLFQRYNLTCEQHGYGKKFTSIARFSREILSRLKDPSYSMNWDGTKKVVGVKRQAAYTHIKLKTPVGSNAVEDILDAALGSDF